MASHQHRQYGFTLIELIVTVSIGIVLAVGGAYGGLYILSTLDLNSALYNTSTTIETARSYTLDHYKGNSYYGFTLAPHSISLFSYNISSQTATIVSTTNISSDVTLTYSGFNNGNSVYFNSLTDLPTANNQAVTSGIITLKTIHGSHNITMNSEGVITIQ